MNTKIYQVGDEVTLSDGSVATVTKVPSTNNEKTTTALAHIIAERDKYEQQVMSLLDGLEEIVERYKGNA